MKPTGTTKDEVERVDCPVCFGVMEDEPCDACNGRGYFLRRKQVNDATLNGEQG